MTHDKATHDLLTHLWRGGTWAYWWTPDGPGYFSKKYQRWEERSKESIWFPVEGEWPAVPAAWAERRNVYFGVHPTAAARERWQRSLIATVSAVNCVFAEFDVPAQFRSKDAILAHLKTLDLYPSAIVDSGGGLHAYWLLNQPLHLDDANRDEWRRTQAAWVALVGSDDGAKDLARVLRLPGYRNRKPERGPDFPTVAIVHYSRVRTYAPTHITELVAEHVAALEAQERRRMAEDAARAPETAGGAAEVLLAGALRHATEGSRHNLALWLAGKLKKEGVSRWAAHSVLAEYARRVNRHGARELTDGEMSAALDYVYSGGATR